MKNGKARKADYLTNKLNKYSIRKFTVGTASILVGSLMFLGSTAEAATAETTTEAATTEAATTEAATTEEVTTETVTAETVKPSETAFNADNSVLSGKATAGDTIIVTLADGTTKETTVKEDGTFSVENIVVASEEVVTVIAKHGDVASESVNVTANKVEAAKTEEATTETPAAVEAETPAAETTTVTEETPTEEQAPVVPEEQVTVTAEEQSVEVAPVTEAVATITAEPTVEAQQEALVAYVAEATGATEEEAIQTIEAMNIDTTNLTSEELMSSLLVDIANEQNATAMYALAAPTTSAGTETESISLAAAAPVSTLAITDAPTLDPVGDIIEPKISGTAAPGSTVTAVSSDGRSWTTVAGEDGSYLMDLKGGFFNAGSIITVTAKDAAGAISPPATRTVIISPSEFDEKRNGYFYVTSEENITGRAEPGYTVEVIYTETGKVYTGIADANGKFSIPMTFEDRYSLQMGKVGLGAYDLLKVAAYDASGNNRLEKNVYIIDEIPVQNPAFYDVTNKDTVLTGTFNEYQATAYLVVQYPGQPLSNPLKPEDFLGFATSYVASNTSNEEFTFDLNAPNNLSGQPGTGILPAGTTIYMIAHAPGGIEGGGAFVGGTMEPTMSIDQANPIKIVVRDVIAPVITAESATVKDDELMTPIPVSVTDETDKEPTITSVIGLPAGVTYNDVTKQIEGTPNVSDWKDGETSRDFTVSITANDDAIGTNDVINTTTKTITITVVKADAPPADTTAPVVDINPVDEDDTTITVVTEPNTEVTVTWPDGTTTVVNSGDTGTVIVPVPEGMDLKPNDVITAISKDDAGNKGETKEIVTAIPAPPVVVIPTGKHTLGDHVWVDNVDNPNNVYSMQDSTDSPLAGVIVTLRDYAGNTVGQTTTDANGYYHFDNLVDGTYVVNFQTPAGYTPVVANIDSDRSETIDSDGPIDVIAHIDGKDNLDVDQGFWFVKTSEQPPVVTPPVDPPVVQPTGEHRLGDYVWIDKNGNSLQDADESPLAGVIVTLRDYAGNTVGSTVTDNLGHYYFDNLKDGTYIVNFQTPVGYSPVIANIDSDRSEMIDSDGPIDVIAIVKGTDNLDVDQGFWKVNDGGGTTTPPVVNPPVDNGSIKHSLGNYVWIDANGNSLQDAGESPLAGVIVTLRDYAGNTVGSTVTDANGYYHFDNLADGTYIVNFQTPAGYTPVIANIDSDRSETIDSDGPIDVIAHINGKDNMDVDQGFWIVGGGSTTPVTPGGGGQPTTPVTPGGGAQPTTPVTPGGGGQPTTPVTPGGSGEPTTPVTPGGSGEPTTPVTPGGSGEPTTPVTPGGEEPTAPVTPAEEESEAPMNEGPVVPQEEAAPMNEDQAEEAAPMNEAVALPDTGEAASTGLAAGAIFTLGGLLLVTSRRRKSE